MRIFQFDLPENLEVKGNIAIDTEAMGLSIGRDRLCLVQICDEDGEVSLVQFPSQDYRAPVLKRLLEDETRKKIFHFARFDLAIMQYYLGTRIQNIFCTKIASKLVRTYTESHGLKELCREILEINISKHQTSSDWGAVLLTKDQQEYAANDVIYLHRLMEKLKENLVREGRMEIAQKLFAFLSVRVDLDLMGWKDIDIFTH